MSQEPNVDLEKLDAFLSKNQAIDLRKVDLRDASSINTLTWVGFDDEKKNLIKQLKIYQRVLWTLPPDREDLAKKLLEQGISSPVQIAHESKEVFIQNNLHLFNGDSALAEQVYIRATTLVSKATSLHAPGELSEDSSDTTGSDTTASDTTSIDLGQLSAFLEKNKAIDFRTADLLHAPNLEQYDWTELEDEKESLIQQLKAYQRMLRVVPPGREELAQRLLNSGFQSSLQIANTPKKAFIQDNLTLFDNDEAIAEQVYLRALALRKAVALQYIAQVQQSEPHIRTTHFVG